MFVVAAGNSLGLVELINRFKPDYCKGLVGKPKLFFIQVEEQSSNLARFVRIIVGTRKSHAGNVKIAHAMNSAKQRSNFTQQACQGSLDDMGHTGERHDDAATIPQLIHKDADIFVFYAAPFGKEKDFGSSKC